jgi:hypothetical protein
MSISDDLCDRLYATFGFSVGLGMRFQVDGKQYRFHAGDIHVLEELAAILARRPHDPNPYWLLPLREQIRHIHAGAVLAYAAGQTNHAALQCLAVWLRGRSGGKIGTPVIANLYRTTDFTVRKEVVRALQRMHAWAALRRIEWCEQSPRIHHLARQRPAKAYRSRMDRFLQQVAPCKLPLGSGRLHEQDGLNLHGGLPPRSPTFIRAVLERIRRLVRGDKLVHAAKI